MELARIRWIAAVTAILLSIVVSTAGAEEKKEPKPAPKTGLTPTKAPTPTRAPTPTLRPKSPAKPGYNIKLKELEEKVTTLKEKIFTTKTRIMLLKEQIINETIAEAKTVIRHSNELGASFRVVRALYFLDDNKIYFQDNRTRELKDTFVIYQGSVVPGNHILTVELVVQGHSPVFTYINGYRFRIRSSFAFHALKGRITQLTVLPYEKGGATTSIEERPSVKYRVQQFQLTKESLKKLSGIQNRDVKRKK